MGLYASQIFPRLMDWVMSGNEFQQLRTLLLQGARGEVLEIGLGTGLNLPHYTGAVSWLHAVDPAPLLPSRVAQRSASVGFPVQVKHVSAENAPLRRSNLRLRCQYLDALHNSRSSKGTPGNPSRPQA